MKATALHSLFFHKLLILGCLVVISLLVSCGSKGGCTDCYAINFDPDANKDDGSCTYLSDRYLGQWRIVDSLSDFLTASIDTYDIQISAAYPNASHLDFSRVRGNYGNIVAIQGDSLCVLSSSLICNGPHGYFITQDSFYFKINWAAEPSGDAHFSVIRGSRL